MKGGGGGAVLLAMQVSEIPAGKESHINPYVTADRCFI